MNKILKGLRNLVSLVALPVVVYVFFFILCKIRGASGFGVGTDLVVMIRTTIYTGFIALAVSFNLTSGRFDFAVGATLVLSVILGANTAIALGLGPVPMLLLCLLFGAILGGLGGIMYVLLRIPPMVVSLGVAMIYEAIGFNVNGGAGAKLIGRNDLLIWSSSPYIYILCICVVAVLVILLNYTQFGYDTNTLRSGQEIAVNIGINEKKNTVICYIIAGALLGGAGVINLSILGTMQPELGLSSISYIQNAFLPMFIGGMLAKYADRNVGVIMGALTQSIITAAFGKLGVSSSWQTILNGIIVLVFFAYSFNSYKIVEFEMFKQKKAMALAAQK